jgi:hypothetical protein
MKRTFLLATFAIALLFGGSLAILAVLTSPVPTPGPTAQLDATAGAPSHLEPPAQPMAVAPDPPPAKLRGGRLYGNRKASAALPSATPADRVTRKAVRKALGAARLQSGLARCADQPGGFGDAPSGEHVPRARPASLLLAIESGADELRIADVQVQDFGGASEASVSCARTVLLGQVVPAPPRRRPRPERVWMSFSLNPRSDAVASSR